MAYVNTEDLRAGMIVARKLLDHNQRVLLQAGVALSRIHIQALHSMDVPGLDIRVGNYIHTLPSQNSVSTIPVETPSSNEMPNFGQPATTSSNNSQAAIKTLRVTRATSNLLKSIPDPLTTRQVNMVLQELLKGTRIKTNTALAEVVKICAFRILSAKDRQKTGINAA